MIETVINDYITLKRHGRIYLGTCPFHNDNKPSLNVIPQKEIYKCFACGAGGNVIKFISKIENIDSEEAKHILFEKYNFKDWKPVKIIKPSISQQFRNRLFEINQETADYYHYQLAVLNNKSGQEYLQQRNILQSEINKFYLGYAAGNNELLTFLTMKGYTSEELLQAGVIRKNHNNELVDVFQNRIIFPIKNNLGKITGFSGRSLMKQSNIKYLNSRETPLFKKYENLYNINNCLTSKTVFLVEGYMDAIAFSKLGLNAIALMGINLSQYQIKLLVNNFNDIRLFLDNDLAGIEAAKKISQTLSNYRNLNLTIIHNPTIYKDMDELVNNFSKSQLLQALVPEKEQAMNF